MDVSLSFILVGLTLPIWMPVLLWFVATQDEKAATDAALA
jgi:hypothetical protein